MSDDEPMSNEEIQAHVGEGSSVDYIQAWFAALTDVRDWALAMGVMTDGLRLLHASAWVDRAIETGQVVAADREQTIHALRGADQTHPSWPEFAEANLSHYDEVVGTIVDNLGIGTRPRPDSIDTEAFHFVVYDDLALQQVDKDGQPMKVTEGPIPAALRVVVQHTAEGPRVHDIQVSEGHPSFKDLSG